MCGRGASERLLAGNERGRAVYRGTHSVNADTAYDLACEKARLWKADSSYDALKKAGSWPTAASACV